MRMTQNPELRPLQSAVRKHELVTAALPDLYAQGADPTIDFEIMEEQVESMRAQREIVDSLGFRV